LTTLIHLAALSEIAARFEEAVARGLWQPRSSSAYASPEGAQHGVRA